MILLLLGYIILYFVFNCDYFVIFVELIQV